MPSATQASPGTPQAPGAPTTSPRVIVTPVQGQAPDIGTLRTQLSDLQVQLNGLQARWDGLKEQLDVMLKNNPARPRVQQEWADAGIQLARVKEQIAYREAQLAQAEGRPISGTTAPPPSPFPIRSVDPDLVVVMSSVLMIVLALPVSVAWARRLLRRTPEAPPIQSDLAPRLENIERAIDTIAIEVERISEGQRFVTKIIAERDRTGGGQSSAAASSASPAPKALGAGPMEPINVAQRERVRERIITPH
jgi:hypothetical protein